MVAKGTSAGRVQSVALRLIVEREEEIEAFVPEEYWNIGALASVESCDPFSVKLVKMAGEEAVVSNGEIAGQITHHLETMPAKLADVRHRTSSQKPQAPLLPRPCSRKRHDA